MERAPGTEPDCQAAAEGVAFQMLRYGKKQQPPERRICNNCQHFCCDIDPHSGWGICNIGKNDGLFMNHTKHGQYLAKHSNGRYYTQTACKVRFIATNEG